MFWATWCPYCKQQMPALALLKKLYSNLDNFEVIPISTDNTGMDAVQNYYRTNNITNLRTYNDNSSELLHAMGFYAIPSLVLISKEGNILGSYSGLQYLDVKYLENVLNKNQI